MSKSAICAKRGRETFYGEEYVISPQADRMGYRLKGSKIEHKTAADILTDATPRDRCRFRGTEAPSFWLPTGRPRGIFQRSPWSSPRTKTVLINDPQNPLGYLMSLQELMLLGKILARPTEDQFNQWA